MFTIVLVVVAVAASVHAESVPCLTGQTACTGTHSLSIINNNILCCPDGFVQQFLNSVCQCTRTYYETDCLQSPTDCQGSSVVSPDGYCCNEGESMITGDTVINGVPVQTCKCRRHVHLIVTSNGTRETTPQEEAQLSQGLNELMNGVDSLLSNLFGSRQIQQQPIRGAPANTADTSQRRANMQQNLQAMQARLLQQRQQLQLRMQPYLQRVQQNVRGQRPGQGQPQQSTGGFWNTFNRFRNDPIMGPLFRPTWWLNQDWRGIFGMERNNATTTTGNTGSNSGSAVNATAGNNSPNPGTVTTP